MMAEEATLSDYIKKPLIFLQEEAETPAELFDKVYEQAFELGWVNEDFIERIKAREEDFPTGIQLENSGAAIPHTDPECVLQEFIAVVVPKEGVPFSRMDDKDQKVNAKIIFVLGLNQPHAQLAMLQSLMALLQNEELLSKLVASPDADYLLEEVKKIK